MCPIICAWEITVWDLSTFYDDTIAQSHLGLKTMALVLGNPGALTKPLTIIF